MSLSLVVIMSVSVSALVSRPTHQAAVKVETISVKQHTPTKPAPAKPAPAAPAPAPTSSPATTVPSKPASTPSTTRTAPVVKPSPSSNVNGLTPATPATPSSSPASPPVTTGYNSLNWSGYLATGRTFTAVHGSWVTPSATGNGVSTSADAAWVGIGGVTSGDLIQVGTQNTVSASGQVTTYAWYELLPAFETPINSMAVHPGDNITASVTNTSGSQWTISINDNSDNQSFSINVSYGSSFSSAEWVEEDPSYSFHQLVPFDNFHAVAFSGGSAVGNGVSLSIAASNALPVTMVTSSGQAIAVPSSLGADGASFSVSP